MLKSSSSKFCGRHRAPRGSGVCHLDLGAGQCSQPHLPTRDGLDVDTQMLPTVPHASYLQGGLPQEACGKLAQAFRAQVVRGQVEEGQAGHSVQGGQQLSNTPIPKPVPGQAKLPER